MGPFGNERNAAYSSSHAGKKTPNPGWMADEDRPLRRHRNILNEQFIEVGGYYSCLKYHGYRGVVGMDEATL